MIVGLYLFTARTGSLTGNITDAETGESLIGVNVLLKGTYYGAATNINGQFTIHNITPGTYNVTISFIGYKAVEYTGIKITERENFTIRYKNE